MSVKEKLEIILITYNRIRNLEHTVQQLLHSPVRDYKITVLDNHSTDGTSEYLTQLSKDWENINHIRHNRNIGGNANICRAFEIASSEYIWVLCDDDEYDWSNWNEVEKAIDANEDVICIADYYIKDKKSQAEIAAQLTFLPAGIYKTSNLTSEVMLNSYYSIYTLFPHLPIVFSVFNEGKKIYLCEKGIVKNGMVENSSDSSHSRGYKENKLYPRINNMTFINGYLDIIEILEDNDLKKECIEHSYSENIKLSTYFPEFIKVNNHSPRNMANLFFALQGKNKREFGFLAVKYYLKRYLFTVPYKKLLNKIRGIISKYVK